MKKGDKFINLYLVHTGQINLYSPKKSKKRPNLPDFNDLPLTPKNEQSLSEECGHIKQNEFKNVDNHCFFNDHNTFCYNFVKCFKSGELIFDEEQFNFESTRIATAVSFDDSEILTILREDYEILRIEFMKQNQTKLVNFIKENYPVTPNDLLFSVFNEFKLENMKKNERMQTEKYDYLCLIYKGEINVYKFKFLIK